MNNSPIPLDYSSFSLEKIAIQRFREANAYLPHTCLIFREKWESSTVLCLDLAACIEQMDEVFDNSYFLMRSLEALGLGKALVFRMGEKFIGWRDVASRH